MWFSLQTFMLIAIHPTGTLLQESMNHIYLNPCSIYQYITDMRVALKGDVAMTKGAKE